MEIYKIGELKSGERVILRKEDVDGNSSIEIKSNCCFKVILRKEDVDGNVYTFKNLTFF